MSMTDPIADLLTRIRNACSASLRQLTVPHSQIKEGIAQVLRDEGFIQSYEVTENEKSFKFLKIKLKYHANRPSIVSLRRISRPGLRVYRSKDKLNEFALDRYSMTVVSTSGGVMSYRQAVHAGLGGEVLCVIS